MAHESHRVGEREGGREASGVAEKYGGAHATEWAGESSRLMAPTPPDWMRSPGVTKPHKGPQYRRDGQERGREDENPPTARSTRMQGANGGNDDPMGEQRT